MRKSSARLRMRRTRPTLSPLQTPNAAAAPSPLSSSAPSSSSPSAAATPHPPPPESALIIVNPFACGPVNVRNAYAAIVKPYFDRWGTLYRSGSEGIADASDAASGGTGVIGGDGDVLIRTPDDEVMFRSSVGRWLEGLRLGRLGDRGGQRKDEVTQLSNTSNSSNNKGNANNANNSINSGEEDEDENASSSSSNNKSSGSGGVSVGDDGHHHFGRHWYALPEVITVFGGDGTVSSVVSLLHDVENARLRKLEAKRAALSSSSPPPPLVSSSPIFPTALLIVPSGMSNGIAASLGTSHEIGKEVIAGRMVGADRAARDGEAIWAASSASRSSGDSSSEEKEGKKGGDDEVVETTKHETSSSPSPSSPASSASGISKPPPPFRFNSPTAFIASLKERQAYAAERIQRRRLVGHLQPHRIVTPLPSYSIALRPTGKALDLLRDDHVRSVRNGGGGEQTYSLLGPNNTTPTAFVCSSSIFYEEGIDKHFTATIGYTVSGGISAGVWANAKIKAHMLNSLQEEYPGLPCMGTTAVYVGLTREMLRATEFPMSIHVGRKKKGGGEERGAATASDLNSSFSFAPADCEWASIEGPFKLVNISAVPSQGFGMSLTPAAATAMGVERRDGGGQEEGRRSWEEDEQWLRIVEALKASALGGISSSPSSSSSSSLPSLLAADASLRSYLNEKVFNDRLVVAAADETTSFLRLYHLMTREARGNSYDRKRLFGGRHPSNAVGVNADKILREDGVEVYGAAKRSEAAEASGAAENASEASSSFLDSPFTSVGLRNDADVPLIAMVDGSPIKIPPHFILEMRPTGRAVTFWA